MAKKPLKVFRKTKSGEMVQIAATPAPATPTAELVLSADGSLDRRGITQRVLDMPEVQRHRSDEAGTSRFDELFHSIFDAVVIADASGRILQVNARAEMYFLEAGEAMRKRNVVELLCGADTALLREWQAHVNRDQYLLLEAVCQRADNSQFPAEVVVNALRGWGENAMGFFVRDVTARKAAEMELQSMNERLVEAEKIQARLQTLSTLYYELNGPLQVLVTMAELDKLDAYREQLDRIIRILGALRRQEKLDTVEAEGGARFHIHEEPPAPSDRMRALVVEKDSMLRDLFARALRSHFAGVTVDTAPGAAEALALFEAGHHGLVVMDVSRTDARSEEAIADMRALCRDKHWVASPVVMCAGFDIEPWMQALLDAEEGFVCLTKPVAVQELVASARPHLGQA